MTCVHDKMFPKGVFMKKVLLLLGVLSIISVPCYAVQNGNSSGLSNGQTVKKYDKTGSYQGYYRQSGSTTKEYGKTGSYQGSYKESGNKVKHYDKTGSYQGYYKK